MKKCTKCGEAKPLGEFGKDSKNKDQLAYWCKPCFRASNVAWAKANREKQRAATANWAANNPERVKATQTKWREANRNQYNATAARWRAAHPEASKKASSEWRAKNQEAVSARGTKYRIDNLDAFRVYAHNRRARERKAGGKLSPDLAERLYKLQRGKCACCKKPLGDKYHLDHIMPLALGGTNADDNIQLLRAECNGQKHAKHPVDFMQQRGFLL